MALSSDRDYTEQTQGQDSLYSVWLSTTDEPAAGQCCLTVFKSTYPSHFPQALWQSQGSCYCRQTSLLCFPEMPQRDSHLSQSRSRRPVRWMECGKENRQKSDQNFSNTSPVFTKGQRPTWTRTKDYRPGLNPGLSQGFNPGVVPGLVQLQDLFLVQILSWCSFRFLV